MSFCFLDARQAAMVVLPPAPLELARVRIVIFSLYDTT